MRVLAVIPARSGSKGVPHKNIQEVAGKPLLAWSVEFSVAHPSLSATYISTDSPEYESVAQSYGASSLGCRPAELADDHSRTSDAVCHLLDQLADQGESFTHVVLLQPTSPQRHPEELDQMLAQLEPGKIEAVVSVAPFDEPHPYKLKTVDGQGMLHSFMPQGDSEQSRQSLPPVHVLTGAYYVITVETLMKERTFLPLNTTAAFVTAPIINVNSQLDLMTLSSVLQAS